VKLTYEQILNDPSLLQRTLAAARCERAEAVHRILFAPIQRLLSLKAQPALRTSACG